MKYNFKNALCAWKKLEISKHYDYKTEFKNKDASSPCFSMHLKGDFSVTPIDILICTAAVVGTYAVCSLVKKIKK